MLRGVGVRVTSSAPLRGFLLDLIKSPIRTLRPPSSPGELEFSGSLGKRVFLVFMRLFTLSIFAQYPYEHPRSSFVLVGTSTYCCNRILHIVLVIMDN